MNVPERLLHAVQVVQQEMPGNNAVLVLVKAAQEISEATSPEEAKHVRDKIVAVETYAKQLRVLRRSSNAVAVVRIETERKLGKLLSAKVKPGSHTLRLPAGVSQKQSSLWQKLSRIADHVFDAVIREHRETDELTTSAIVRWASSSPPGVEVSSHPKQEEHRADPGSTTERPWSIRTRHEIDLRELAITVGQIIEAFPEAEAHFSGLPRQAIVQSIRCAILGPIVP